MASEFVCPPFVPHPLLPSGHLQTLIAGYLPADCNTPHTKLHRVPISDVCAIALHEDVPATWKAGDRVTMLVHGLGGTARSGYMRRAAVKLTRRGVRTFRLELRGVGKGATWSNGSYNAGQSADVAAAIEFIAELCPNAPLSLVGFSLAGNIVLKLAGELGSNRCGNLVSVMAVCPPVDLSAASDQLGLPSNRFYDRYFANTLVKSVRERIKLRPDVSPPPNPSPRTLREFDARYTAIVGGYGSLENYYRTASAAALIANIHLPTLILAALDDPLIPSTPIRSRPLPKSVQLLMTEHGGHLGFFGKLEIERDHRWLDWRVVDWIMSRGAIQKVNDQ
jgi:predicted alpha/beta-fold hydrolase